MDSAVIKRTQDSLGKYVKKPPLTEKLLNKPPFRFLFDVFNAVNKATGCFEGLYTTEEQNIDNIKDRDDKMKYLQKMIDVIKIATNRDITVRTSKIVAGQEPEKTNELLQLIGEVIEKQLDWRSAVESVINKSSSPSKPQKAPEKSKEKSTKSRENSTKELQKESKARASISPVVKEDSKSKLKSTSKKEKTKTPDGKLTKEKQHGEAKDKVTRKTKDEKPKQTKSKTVVTKEKTPSPKIEEKVKIIENEKDEILDEVQTESQEKQTTPLKNLVSNNMEKQVTKQETVHVPMAAEQRVIVENSNNSKEQDHKENTRQESPSPQLSSSLNTASDQFYADHMESDAPKTTGSRKSSASRKSSEKSRRSSASKSRNNESDASQATSTPIESLPTLNEDDRSKLATPTDNQIAPPLEQQKPKAESPKLADNDSHIVKRESTFTRDNSKETSNNRPRTSLRPPSARPASARPGAPRRRDRNVEIILQPNDQIKMSGVNIKLETFGDFGDDGENLVIIENANVDETLAELGTTKSGNDGNIDNDMEQRGHLVQQILETQKELVQQTSDLPGRQEKDTSVINMRQSSARQMNNLRDVIQNLTKSVNPFGKLMDFIPEDIDAMQLELTMWRDSYTQTANELKKEKSLTESVTEPMKSQLTQIEANIKEYQEIIDASHNKILQNSEKILKLLTEQ